MPEEDTKKCPYCAEIIKKEAILCRFCGKDLREPVAPPPVVEEKTVPATPATQTVPQSSTIEEKPVPLTPNPTESSGTEKNKDDFRTFLLVTSAVVIFLVCFLIWSKVSSITKTHAADPISVTLTPSFLEIIETMDGMTDAQKDHYFATLRGTYVYLWQGTISDVNEDFLHDYTVYVDVEDRYFGSEVHFPVEEDVAVALNKGQLITFSGTVDQVTNVLSVTLHLQDDVVIE